MSRSPLSTSASGVCPFSLLSAISEKLDPSGLASLPLTLGNGWDITAVFQPDQGKALKALASLVSKSKTAKHGKL